MKLRLIWLSFWRSLLPDHRIFSLGVGILGGLALALSALVTAVANGTFDTLNDNSTLSLIDVDSQTTNGEPVSLTPEALTKFRQIPHVTDVIPWAQSGLILNGAQGGVVVFATATAPSLVPQCLPSFACPTTLDDHSIILPTRVNGVDLTGLAGTDAEFSYQQLQTSVQQPDNVQMQGTTVAIKLHVVGLFDPSDAKADGLSAAYVSLANATTFQAAYQGMTTSQFQTAGYSRVFLQADSAADTHLVVSALASMGISSTSYFALTHQLPQALRLVQSVSVILGITLLLLCLLVGTSIGSAIALSRRRVVGLLKAIGWSTPQVAGTLVGEVGLLGLAIGASALVMGLAVGWLATALAGGRTVSGIVVPSHFHLPSGLWLFMCLVGPAVAMMIGALPRTIRTAMVPPDEALRDL